MASTAVATRRAAAPPVASGEPAITVEPQVSRWGALPAGAAVLGAAQAMLFAALVGVFLLARSGGGKWPPEAIHIDTYRGSTIAITALLASGLVQWAVYAARHDDTRHTSVGIGLAFLLELALADLAWFSLVKFGVGAGSSAYATLLYAMLGTFVLLSLATAGALLVTAARAIAGQFSSADHQMVSAVAVQAHAISLIAVVLHWAIWIRK